MKAHMDFVSKIELKELKGSAICGSFRRTKRRAISGKVKGRAVEVQD